MYTIVVYYNYHSIPTTYYGVVSFMLLLLTQYSTQAFLKSI